MHEGNVTSTNAVEVWYIPNNALVHQLNYQVPYLPLPIFSFRSDSLFANPVSHGLSDHSTKHTDGNSTTDWYHKLKVPSEMKNGTV